jgi:hypothetical protein
LRDDEYPNIDTAIVPMLRDIKINGILYEED